VAEVRAKLRVVAACAEASRRGITPGMALTQAQALAAELVHAPFDADQLARRALDVSTALLEASPRVSWWNQWPSGPVARWPRNEGVWWVDAAGLGEEKKLAQQLLRIAKTIDGGPVHVGIADSAIAAYAATFPRATRPLGHSATVAVPSGRDAAFLARYPLGLLDLDEELAGTFAALGLTSVGQVAALDGDEVEARFGPEGLAAWRLARGLDARGPSLPRDDAIPAAACELGAAVATAEPLLFVLKGALVSLGSALRAKGLVAREIAVTLALDDGSSSARSVRPARPTSHEAALFDHCRALLDDWRLEEPVTGITVRATDTAPAAGEQGDLLAVRWADPAALDAAFERIRGREGMDAVAVPEALDGHLPGEGGSWQTRGPGIRQRKSGPLGHGATGPLSSALRLLPHPRAIRVRLGRSGLEAFKDGDAWTDVTGWSGPERIAPKWWRTTDGARDYFGARAGDGTLWILFRTRKTWFLEGWWD
jgi:protein ImuB